MNEAEILKKIVLGDNTKLDSFVAKVTKVYDRTCDVEISLTGATLKDVRLNTAGKSILIKPEENSHVVVTKLNNSDSFVSLHSEIKEVAFNIKGDITLQVEGGININSNGDIIFDDGENDGLIKIEKLTTKLNKLVTWCKSHTHTIPASGVNVSGSASAQSNTAEISIPVPDDAPDEFDMEYYINKKIQH